MQLFLVGLSAHFIGDFAFHTRWMAEEKGRDWEVLLYHVLVYTSTLFLVFLWSGHVLPALALFLIVLSHFIIDASKARWNLISHIWMDQLLHIIVIAAVVFILTLRGA